VGYRFNPHLSLLTEYQFIANKLPGAQIAETGANGGYAQTWSFTLAPVLDLFPKHANDLYITGGGGFYRKVTSFTDPVLADYCGYYYCGVGVTNAVVGHFSSNQGGANAGIVFYRKIFGQDSNAKFYAEARYVWVNSPVASASNSYQGSGTEALIPVSFGIRF